MFLPEKTFECICTHISVHCLPGNFTNFFLSESPVSQRRRPMKWPVPSWRWHTDCWDSPIVYLCWVWGWKMCTTWLVEGRDLLSICSIMLCAVCWVDCIRRKWRKFTEDKINGGFFLLETISRSFFFLFRSRVSSTLKDRSMFEVCHRHHDNCKDMYICSLILASFYVKMNVMEYMII